MAFTFATPAQGSGIKLDTLIALRWIAIAGQAVAILVVGVFLHFPMEVGLSFALTALSAWLNLFLKLRFPASLRLTDTGAAVLLAYDSLQLAALLYLTGGLENPFALLLLVPVLVSATALSIRHTIALGLLTIAAISVLWAYHEPLPWPVDEDAPTCRCSISAASGWRTSARLPSPASTPSGSPTSRGSSRMRCRRPSWCSSASITSPPSTVSPQPRPTSSARRSPTITVVAKELQKEMDPASPHAADIQLLVTQSERCREILSRLTSLGSGDDWTKSHRPLTHLLADAAEPYQGYATEVKIITAPKTGPEPIGDHNPAILYGLGNLIENAVEFARRTVEITAKWTNSVVTVEIADDGPGFAPEIIDRMGEPYVTTRVRPSDPSKPDHEAGGLGLGFSSPRRSSNGPARS